jgi:hypothetical protein
MKIEIPEENQREGAGIPRNRSEMARLLAGVALFWPRTPHCEESRRCINAI